MASRSRFEELGEEDETVVPLRTAAPSPSSEAPPERQLTVLFQAVILGLQLLSEKTVQLGYNLLPVIVVGLDFLLAQSIIGEPSWTQIATLGVFMFLSLALLVTVRRK